jgi:hypothetical protein
LQDYCPRDRKFQGIIERYHRDKSDHSEGEMKAFCKAFEKVMIDARKDNIKFLVGNCNAKRTWTSANEMVNMIDLL